MGPIDPMSSFDELGDRLGADDYDLANGSRFKPDPLTAIDLARFGTEVNGVMRDAGLIGAGFMSPPKTPDVDRAISGNGEGGYVISIRTKDRPRCDVLGDMIAGLVHINPDMDDQTRRELDAVLLGHTRYDDLMEALDAAGRRPIVTVQREGGRERWKIYFPPVDGRPAETHWGLDKRLTTRDDKLAELLEKVTK